MYQYTHGGTAVKTIHIEFSDERLITPSGLVFVGQILGKSSFVKKINRAPISSEYYFGGYKSMFSCTLG